MSTLDVVARSATTTPPPGVRKTAEVAKLVDESKCIGCKACQVACMNWNDLRDETEHVLRGAPVEVTVKLHPLQDRTLHEHAFDSDATVQLAPEGADTRELIIASDGVVGFQTTALFEAMAAGTPIVCSDIHGYKGVVRRGREGLLVPPRKPKAIKR